jgi:peroxiredoxin Q/BCP
MRAAELDVPPPLPSEEYRVMVAVDQPAPDFTLADQNGKEVSLSKLRGKPVVLYFYPKDDTPGCTKEACAFRDARSEYEKAGATVIGVSPDDVKSHRKFADKFTLPFTLLADPDRAVCQAYGVWKEKNMYGKKSMGVERTTFVIDGNGLVRKIYPRVKVDGHADAVLEAIKSL